MTLYSYRSELHTYGKYDVIGDRSFVNGVEEYGLQRAVISGPKVSLSIIGMDSIAFACGIARKLHFGRANNDTKASDYVEQG